MKACVMDHSLDCPFNVCVPIGNHGVSVLTRPDLLISLGRHVNVEVVKLLDLNMVGMLMALAVVPAQTEQLIGSWDLYSQND